MTVRRWHFATVVALIAIAASASSIANDFTYDDRPLILDNARVHSLSGIPQLFGQTYWPESNGAALYRPLTMTMFAMQWAVGGGSPRVYHAISILLYAASCALVTLLLLRLTEVMAPRWTGDGDVTHEHLDAVLENSLARTFAALAAGMLFAAHPVHVEAVGNVVGQSELLAAICVVAATLRYVEACESGVLEAANVGLIALLYVLACMSKEHAIVLPALLLAAEATILRDVPARVTVLQRARPIVALGVVGVAFLALRAAVVGGVTGEFAHLAWGNATFGDRVLTMLRVAPEWARLLIWPAHLSGDYSPRQIEVVHEVTASVFSGIIVVGSAVALIVLSSRRRPLIAFGLAWTAIALLPVSNIFVASGVLLAERTLFLPSVGVVIVVAGVMEMIASRIPTSDVKTWHQLAAAGIVLALVLAGTVKSAARQHVWRDNRTFFAQLLEDAPLSYRAHWAKGAQLFDAGDKSEGEIELRLAAELFPRDPDLLEDLASRYLRAGFCKPAVTRFRQVLDLEPSRSTARVGLVACLIRDGDNRAAATEARAGLRFGTDTTQLARLARVADSLSGVAP